MALMDDDDRRSRRRRRSRSGSRSPRARRHHSRRSRSRSRDRRAPRSRSVSRSRAKASLPSTTTTPAAAVAALPVARHRAELVAAVRDHPVVICVGETGSGKTTQLPQYLLADLGLPPTAAAIAVTQPRRVATVAVARRVAEERGVDVGGDDVGYAVRFDDRSTAATRLRFVTDGVLVRECLADPLLRRYGVVVLDEAHERSLDTDLLLGLLRRVLERRRLQAPPAHQDPATANDGGRDTPDKNDESQRLLPPPPLRLVIASATLDPGPFVAFFGGHVPVVTIPGRAHDVELFHSSEPLRMGPRGPLGPYVTTAVDTALAIHRGEAPDGGHILVFLTGQREVEDACRRLREALDNDNNDTHERHPAALVLPLYGALAGHRQHEIFAPPPTPGTRKIVVATNLAETSLTIDGVRFVVDCGLTKQRTFNPTTGAEALVVVPISQVAAQQRAGRAGRTAPGKCYRLYARASYETLEPARVPEIQRTDLASALLRLKALGVNDVLGFAWLDPPPRDAVLAALAQLAELEALDDQGRMTPRGRIMARLPLSPRLACALVVAVALDCAREMTAIVAMLAGEAVFDHHAAPDKPSQHQRSKHRQADDVDDEAVDAVAAGFLRLARDELVHDTGDHLTFGRILTAFQAQQEAPDATPGSLRRWCRDRRLRLRALSTASAVQRQLLELLEALPRADLGALGSAGLDADWRRRSTSTRLRRALCTGFVAHAVRRCSAHASVYRPLELDDEEDVDRPRMTLLHVHPTSALQYVALPSTCIYHELVVTSRPFLRGLVAVEGAWLRADHRRRRTHEELLILGGAASASASATSTTTMTTLEATASSEVDDPPLATTTSATSAATSAAKSASAASAAAIAAARARFLARKQQQHGPDHQDARKRRR